MQQYCQGKEHDCYCENMRIGINRDAEKYIISIGFEFESRYNIIHRLLIRNNARVHHFSIGNINASLYAQDEYIGTE